MQKNALELNSILEFKVTHEGKWKVTEEITIDCYVTNDKRRLMSLRGAGRAMNLRGGGSTALHRVLKAKWTQPYLTDQLKSWINRATETKFSKMKAIYGPPFIPFEATLFVDVCKAYIDADNAGVLNKQQKITADRLLSIMTAFAKIGIIALVDEITGYQEERQTNELQKLLSVYISKELLEWTKIFHDEFYEQLFKLKGWEPFKVSGQKMPQIVGYYTNDIVYERLPKDVLRILKERTPKSASGNNVAKLHQSLSQDIGRKHLEKHLIAVIALMKVSDDWNHFLYLLDKSYKRKGQLVFRWLSL